VVISVRKWPSERYAIGSHAWQASSTERAGTFLRVRVRVGVRIRIKVQPQRELEHSVQTRAPYIPIGAVGWRVLEPMADGRMHGTEACTIHTHWGGFRRSWGEGPGRYA
jgi:hypothetical protein